VSSSRFPSTRSDDIRFPDGIPAEVELLRERLVDDRNPGRVGGIGGSELAAGKQAASDRPEVIRPDLVVVGIRVGIRAFLDRDLFHPELRQRLVAHAFLERQQDRTHS
jgi:hypothetical protein